MLSRLLSAFILLFCSRTLAVLPPGHHTPTSPSRAPGPVTNIVPTLVRFMPTPLTHTDVPYVDYQHAQTLRPSEIQAMSHACNSVINRSGACGRRWTGMLYQARRSEYQSARDGRSVNELMAVRFRQHYGEIPHQQAQVEQHARDHLSVLQYEAARRQRATSGSQRQPRTSRPATGLPPPSPRSAASIPRSSASSTAPSAPAGRQPSIPQPWLPSRTPATPAQQQSPSHSRATALSSQRPPTSRLPRHVPPLHAQSPEAGHESPTAHNILNSLLDSPPRSPRPLPARTSSATTTTSTFTAPPSSQSHAWQWTPVLAYPLDPRGIPTHAQPISHLTAPSIPAAPGTAPVLHFLPQRAQLQAPTSTIFHAARNPSAPAPAPALAPAPVPAPADLILPHERARIQAQMRAHLAVPSSRSPSLAPVQLPVPRAPSASALVAAPTASSADHSRPQPPQRRLRERVRAREESGSPSPERERSHAVRQRRQDEWGRWVDASSEEPPSRA